MGEIQLNHIIALNPYRKGNKGKAFSCSLAEYDKVIATPWLKSMVEEIRGGNDKLKRELPFYCPHYGKFKSDSRRQNCLIPEAFLFQTTIDVDDANYVDKAIEKARELNCSETIWNGMLLHLCYSARRKLHIDIRMPIGMTIEETQLAYCQALGVPYDESCISPERMIFITDKDSEIYRSKRWCAVLPAEELEKRRKAFLDRGLTIDGRKSLSQITQIPQIHSSSSVQGTVDLTGATETSAKSAESAREENNPSARENSASDKNLVAFDLFVQQAGLADVNIDTEGSRHPSLLAIMSAGASRVMGEEELKRVVGIRMPSFAQEGDCQHLIHDFYAKYGDSAKPMSQAVIRINAQAEKLALGGTKVSVDWQSAEQASCQQDDYPAPPPMPEHLPKLVELLVSKTPEEYKPAVANAIFPPLATHLWNVRFNYIDNVEHEATLMCCLLAGTGAGKSCVQKPINYIMEDIRARDRENLEREKAWKDEITRKGANKDKRKRPQNLIIQEIDADMTNPAFVMRTAEAQGHFLYTSLNEIDQFDALKGIGNQQFRIMCYAFDPDNQYGQTRVGTQSVTERVTIRFNWNASTTIEMGQRYFSKVLTNGPLSRINFCTIPEREIGEEMPVYGTYDEAFKEALVPYIENLCKATGLIDCPEAFALAKKLKDENAEFSRLCQDRIYENFSFRANVIAYLKACVLYVANGCQWEPEMEDFIRWSEQYDLYCKMRFFADAIKKHNEEGEKSSKRGPSNLLQLLPDEFTFTQAEAVRQAEGLSKKGTNVMINAWVHRQYIERLTPAVPGRSYDNYKNDSFKKLKFLKN